MQKNQRITLRCEGLGSDMEGVCRADGMAVFVPGLLPGEEAEVRIVKDQKRYAFGRVEALRTASPQRVTPDCPAYPRCGGCTARHMTYAATLEAKRQQVQDCFQRIGRLGVSVAPVLGMESPTAYRNKTALPVTGTAEAPAVGFFAPRSHSVIPVRACPNAMPPTNELANAFCAWAGEHQLSVYDEEAHQGLLRHLVIRVNRQGQAMVTVVIHGSRLPDAEGLGERLFPLGCVSLYVNRNDERTNVIFGRAFTLIRGQETLEDMLLGYRYALSPGAFFQVNPAQTEVLYRTALTFAAPSSGEIWCDLYCGAGTITLPLAAQCKQAIGIEIVPQAIENARANAARNGIDHVDFRCGAVEDVLPKLVAQGLRPDGIIVDPPRKGLDPRVIQAIAEASPRRVVYVSCNPATLARDAGLLAEAGYHVDAVQPVDMFCWTSGIETVLKMSRSNPSAL